MRKLTFAVATVAAIFFGGQVMASNANNSCVGNCPTTNNVTNNTTNKGGTGIGVGISKSSSNSSSKSSSKSSASASVNNTSVNVNSNKAQGGEAAASADNGGISIKHEAAAASAVAPSINPSATCQVPVTLGGQALIGGGSFGTTYTSEDCVQREDTRMYCEIAQRGFADVSTCRALADDLPTVRKYKARMAEQASAGKTSGYAPATEPSATFGNVE
jgi:hypothetical protein